MTKSKLWNLDAERELLADACSPGRSPHSFWNFVRYASGWHYRCQEPGQVYWLTDETHRAWCDWAEGIVLAWKQARREKKGRRVKVIDCVPRGFGKSNMITKCLPIWSMLDEPNQSWYIGSETHPKAKAFLAPIKTMLDGTDKFSRFTWLYGNWYNPDREWNQEAIVTAYRTSTGVTEPSVGTFGVETGITSKHPLGVIYDDPISEEKLRDGGNWMTLAIRSLDSIYPALRDDSLIWLIGTRYKDDDPIGYVLNNEGVATWFGHDPLEDFRDGSWHVHFLQSRDRKANERYEEGEPTCPVLYDHESLLEKERENPQRYATQYMNNPVLDGTQELTPEAIETMKIDRKDVPPSEYATIHIDTAFKNDDRRGKGDYSAIVVWLHDLRPTGIVYLDRALRSKNWTLEEFDSQLLHTVFDLKRRGIRLRAITDEKEMGGKRGVYSQHITQLLKGAGLRPCEIFLFNRAGTKKTIRIREAAAYWLDGFVRLVRDAPGLDALIHEMKRIGTSANDDVSDAAADVFRPEVWRGRQATDTDGQPILPKQPGDEILKGVWETEMDKLATSIQTGVWENEDKEHQPFEALQGRNEDEWTEIHPNW